MFKAYYDVWELGAVRGFKVSYYGFGLKGIHIIIGLIIYSSLYRFYTV